jgi:hypothetical protein
MCCPSFLFILPGMLLVILGLAAIPAAVLSGYGVWSDFFGPNFMYVSSLVALTGFHIVVFGFWPSSSPIEAIRLFRQADREVVEVVPHRTRPAHRRRPHLRRDPDGSAVFIHWLRTFELNAAAWIFAGTIFVIGLETIFLAFLVGIIDMAGESAAMAEPLAA